MKFNARLTPFSKVGNNVNVMGRSLDVSVEAFNAFDAEKKLQSMYPGYRIAYMHIDRSDPSYEGERRQRGRVAEQEGGEAIGHLVAYMVRHHPRLLVGLVVAVILFFALPRGPAHVESEFSGIPRPSQAMSGERQNDPYSIPHGDPDQTGKIMPDLGMFKPSDRLMSDQPDAKR